jgi:hypothetical protein
MKASASTNNLHEKIFNKNTNDNELKKFIKKRSSLQEDIYKNEIFKKIHEGSILNFIRTIPKREIVETDRAEKGMKYDLSMLNKYDEDLNSSLSFISEFDLENDNEEDNSFNSSFDDNSVEEIEIVSKVKK